MGGFYTDGVPNNEEDVLRQLSDVGQMRIAAARTHLGVAGDTDVTFSERLERLRNAHLLLNGASHTLFQLCTCYNQVHAALRGSPFYRGETLPPIL